MKRLGNIDAFKDLQDEAERRVRLLRAAHLLGIDYPQRRSTEDLVAAVRHRIDEVKKVLA